MGVTTFGFRDCQDNHIRRVQRGTQGNPAGQFAVKSTGQAISTHPVLITAGIWLRWSVERSAGLLELRMPLVFQPGSADVLITFCEALAGSVVPLCRSALLTPVDWICLQGEPDDPEGYDSSERPTATAKRWEDSARVVRAISQAKSVLVKFMAQMSGVSDGGPD